MAAYITDHPTANDKLVSAVWSVEEIDGVLYGRIDCRSAVAFTEEEIEALKDGISGQNSDGFGEGFEQRPIETDEGDMYVSFWNSGDDYFIRTKEEMDERYSAADFIDKSADNAHIRRFLAEKHSIIFTLVYCVSLLL